MTIFEKIKIRVKEQFPKEYACHLLFVLEVALDLNKRKGGDREIIEIASIAHDIGRVQGGDNHFHAEASSEKIIIWLKELGYNDKKISMITRCVMMHNKTERFHSIEEEIVSNADSLSKFMYHDMFMLMCEKDNYLDRARWGLKYIEKGYIKLTFPDLKEEYRPLYEKLKKRYESIVNT